MDTPKNRVWSFANFPPDIWAYITCYLPGEQLGRLKMTGSKILWNKLRYLNVVKSINLGKDFLLLKSWPGFLNELSSISELSIDSYNSTGWLPCGLKLDCLPSTLRVLKIKSTQGDSSDFFVSKEGDQLYLDEQVPHIEEIDFQEFELADDSWMARAPQSLTKLSIRSWNADTELPPSVIHLIVSSNFKLRQRIGLRLPSGIETIDLPRISDLRFLVSILPSTFGALTLGTVGYLNSTLDLGEFPRSMTSLGSIWINSDELSRSPETIALLPQSLTTLDIRSVLPSACWALLPPTLKNLTVTMSEDQCATLSRNTINGVTGEVQKINTYPFELLPRSMTRLKLQTNDYLPPLLNLPAENTSVPIFPPMLTVLQIESSHLSPNAAKHLPASLRELSIFGLCEHVCKHLPKGLTQLKVSHALATPNFVKFLPKSLTSLDMCYARAATDWYDHKTGERLQHGVEIPKNHFGKEPTTDLNWQGEYSLPPTLTHLLLSGFTIDDNFAKQSLLRLPDLNLCTNPVAFTDFAIPLLNRHLTSLNLSSAVKITGKSFPSLPRSLTYLVLGCSLVSDSDIQFLPRDLKHMSLNSVEQLTDGCVPQLPPHLVYLSLKRCYGITKSVYPDLPYAIKSSQLSLTLDLGRWKVSKGKIVDR